MALTNVRSSTFLSSFASKDFETKKTQRESPPSPEPDWKKHSWLNNTTQQPPKSPFINPKTRSKVSSFFNQALIWHGVKQAKFANSPVDVILNSVSAA